MTLPSFTALTSNDGIKFIVTVDVQSIGHHLDRKYAMTLLTRSLTATHSNWSNGYISYMQYTESLYVCISQL